MYDPDLYRDKAEIEQWKHRDPIPALITRLRDRGELSDAALAELETAIAEEIAAAIRTAEAAEPESVAELTRFVHSEGSGP